MYQQKVFFVLCRVFLQLKKTFSALNEKSQRYKKFSLAKPYFKILLSNCSVKIHFQYRTGDGKEVSKNEQKSALSLSKSVY